MTDDPEAEAEAVADQEPRPWWVDEQGQITPLGARYWGVEIAATITEISLDQYERQADRIAHYLQRGAWPKRPDLKPIPGGKG